MRSFLTATRCQLHLTLWLLLVGCGMTPAAPLPGVGVDAQTDQQQGQVSVVVQTAETADTWFFGVAPYGPGQLPTGVRVRAKVVAADIVWLPGHEQGRFTCPADPSCAAAAGMQDVSVRFPVHRYTLQVQKQFSSGKATIANPDLKVVVESDVGVCPALRDATSGEWIAGVSTPKSLQPPLSECLTKTSTMEMHQLNVRPIDFGVGDEVYVSYSAGGVKYDAGGTATGFQGYLRGGLRSQNGKVTVSDVMVQPEVVWTDAEVEAAITAQQP